MKAFGMIASELQQRISILAADYFLSMKAVPFLRFALAIYILIDAFIAIQTKETLPAKFPELIALSVFLDGAFLFVKVIFVAYCLITGLQEMLSRDLIHAKIFNLFGLVYEVIVLLGSVGFFILLIVAHPDYSQKNILISAVSMCVIIILIAVDVKRMRHRDETAA